MTHAIGPLELAALCDIALAAGREIMQVYEAGTTGGTASTSKDDGSPLTEADLRADRVIRARLEREFPGVFILSEESGERTGQAVPQFFLVDPLDGTKEFLNRNGEFTVNIAFVSQGVSVAGVVFAPALGELYRGARGQGAFKGMPGEAKPIAVAPSRAGQTLRVMGSRSHGTDAMGRWLEALGRPHEFVAAGSSLKFCRIAEGLADVYPRMGPTSQWDTAAGQAVLEAAGGSVMDARGAPLRYGVDRAILNPYFMAVGRVEFTLPPIG
jgi:3'(2'),5'-bisphosphate nucleotidase